MQLNSLDLDFDWSFPKVIQVILQTPTIIDGLRRCSRSVEMQASRPGREVITFLIVCNLSMWFMETLEIKSYETNMDRIHFYGEWLAKSMLPSVRNIDTIFTTRDQGTHFGRCSVTSLCH